ncbi:MAG: hypothetical protein H7329_00530 [Opitutaceae bacterium]|nr:hypothetical protein [Cytophagales bacterium]
MFGEGRDSIQLGTFNWGMYTVGFVKSFVNKDTISSICIIGSEPDSLYKSAIYLADNGSSITFAGKTFVRGNAFLPKSGVNSGSVDGQKFQFKNLVDGKISISKDHLPELDNEFLKKMLKNLNSVDKANPAFKLPTDSLNVSFYNETQRYHSSGIPFILKKNIIRGNVMLSSDTLISIGSNVSLENIILFAPIIKFEKGFKGIVQAFATDSIIISENCDLKFPSALSIIPSNSSNNRPGIYMGRNSRLDGCLLQYTGLDKSSLANTYISESATIHGIVYADAFLSLNGIIYGSLLCNKILLNRPSGVYANHLLNCTIDRTRLSTFFVTSPIFSRKKKQIISRLK